MKTLLSFLIGAALSLTGIAHHSIAFAQSSASTSISDVQKSALTQRLNHIDAALLSGNLDRIVEAVAPESYRRALGTGLGIGEGQMDEFLQTMDALMHSTMALTTIKAHRIDYDNISFGMSPQNTPIATIPYEMEMDVSGLSFLSSGDYYGVFRDDWMVISASDENTARLMNSVFPELANTQIVASVITPISGSSK